MDTTPRPLLRTATGLGLVVLALAACASPAPPRTLEIANRTPRAIASLRATPCGAGGPGRELLRDEIERGQSRRFALTEPCIDLVAVDPQGRVSGEQRGLAPLSDAVWTLR